MIRRRLLAVVMLAVAAMFLPVKRDAEAALGLGLANAACAQGDCGYWNPMIDCVCPDLHIPHHWPRCALDADQ